MYSQQDWQGIESSKFNYSEKIHLRVQDQLVNYQGDSDGLGLGKKHFEHKYDFPKVWKSSLVTNMKKPGDGFSQEFLPGKKTLQFTAKEKPPRPQRDHIREGKSSHIEDLPYGIKTNINPTGQDKRHELEEMMGQKKRLHYLSQVRNGLNVVSLGDKAYKHTDYAADFFKEGGLAVGSTNILRKVNINQLHEKEMEKKLNFIQSQIKKGMKWTDKVKFDNEKEKQDDVKELDVWLETTLKPSNPNYQDPDKFFENLEKQQQQDPKAKQAAAKKGSKK